MKTRRLTQTELFVLLSSDGQTKVVTLSELVPAYDEFIDALTALSDDAQHTSVLRCLYYTKAELHALQRTSNYKAGKNLLTHDYIIKALELVESEIVMLHLQIKFPEQFIKQSSEFKSPLFWSKNHKAIELSEILCGMELDGAILTSSGEPASFAMIIRCFNMFLNTNMGDPHNTKQAIFMRKINLTKYIDKLRHALRKHREEVVDR